MMPSLKNQTAWEHGKKLLSDAYGYQFLAETWPQRLGIDDIAVLQSGDIESPDFAACEVCLTKAAEVGEISMQPQQWGVATDSPPEFWTGAAPTRYFLIPLCQEHLIDGAILWPYGLQLKYTITPLDFAEYLRKQHVQPSKFIVEWFFAFGIDTTDIELHGETPRDVSVSIPKKRTTKLNKWLREKWDEWGKPNARDFAAKLRPLEGTMGCPVKRYYGWLPKPAVVVEWQKGWGATSWGCRAFENKVDDFKRDDKKIVENDCQ